MRKKTPPYVLEAKKKSLATQVTEVLAKHSRNPHRLRDHCYDKDKALEILYDFAKLYKYGVLPDKLVCFRIYIDEGELGLTYVPVYRCWEFYFKNLDKHCRAVSNFKKHLKEHGFNLKKI